MFHQFPYTNLHELNLDWLIKKVKEAYSPDNPPENIVLSVNGQTGNVVLYEGALVELPAIPENDMWQIRRNTQGNINRGIAFAGNGRAYIIEGSETHQIYDSENPPPYPVTSVNSATGAVILYQNPSVIFPEVSDASWRIFRNAGGTTLGIRFTNGKIYRINSTDNFEMYDAGNPPPYPVTSVNGQTGAVNITFPVTSVNGQTGAVNLQIPFVNTAPEILELQTDSPGDYWGMLRNTTNGQVGIYFDSENDTVKAYISYMPEDESAQQPQTFQLLTTNDIPSSSGVVSVNGKTGVVIIRATDISRTENNAETVETALARIDQKDGTQDNAISGLQNDVAKIHEGMAIIADGNTHASIQAGQAVFVKNHATLATGLYWANEAIGTDVALTSSNVTADTNGGLNHLQDEITSLNSKIAWKLLYYNNGSTANALNLDLAKYTMLLFKNNYGESFVICQQANANGAYFATTSRFYTSSIPVVMFQYELKINNDATGIYIDRNESKQININSDGTIQIYPYTSEFDFVRVYGAQIQ